MTGSIVLQGFGSRLLVTDGFGIELSKRNLETQLESKVVELDPDPDQAVITPA